MAEATAQRSAAQEKLATGISQVVSFRLGDEEYGVDIMKVQEIILPGQVTKMPGVPEFIRGLINLRGRVIPVVDLKRRLGLGQTESTEETRIIVASMGGKTVGLVVDAVNEVLRINPEQVEPPPKSVAGISQEYLVGIAKLGDRIVILLDVEQVLSAEEKKQVSDAAEAADRLSEGATD